MKKFSLFLCIICILYSFNEIQAETYVYNSEKEEHKTAEDSVSTMNIYDESDYADEEWEYTENESVMTSATPTFNFQSYSQILMEPQTGTVLYASNENEQVLPASVTKIMTLLLIMERIDAGKLNYTDSVTCSAYASGMGGSQIWFKEGETLTVDEALKAICIVSANDVTVAMAELIGGSEENFVQMMNDKAATLGMTNTHFMNPHGIDEEGHYTTAKDIAIMSRELAINHPDILKYTSIWQDTLRNGTFTLSSTNKLIRWYDGANGLKTGSTSKALFNLAATATRNGTTFLSVVCRAPSSKVRAAESTMLLDYAFANYETKTLKAKDEVIANITVNKNITKTYDTYVKNGCSILQDKGMSSNYIENVILNEEISAPLCKGDSVGKIQFTSENGEVIKEEEIVVNEDIQKSNFLDYFSKLINMHV